MDTPDDPLAAALGAVEAAITRFQTSCSPITIVRQSGQIDMTTTVDLALDDVVRKRLLAAFPTWGYTSEENPVNTSDSRYTWLVDPLCGTLNLKQGFPDINVNITLLEDHHPILGVIGHLTTGTIYFSQRGHGAFCRGHDHTTEPLIVSAAIPLVHIDMGTATWQGGDERTAALFAEIMACGQYDFRAFGSSMAFAHLAAGRLAACVWHGAVPWDICAGSLLVAEAGGVVTDFQGSAWRVDSAGILAAASAAVHDDLLGRVQTYLL